MGAPSSKKKHLIRFISLDQNKCKHSLLYSNFQIHFGFVGCLEHCILLGSLTVPSMWTYHRQGPLLDFGGQGTRRSSRKIDISGPASCFMKSVLADS